MTIQILDVLYLSLAVGFSVLVFYLVTLVKRLIATLDRLDPILDNVRDTTDDISEVRTKVKSTLFSGASMILGMIAGKKK